MSQLAVPQCKENQFKETEKTVVLLLSDLIHHGFFKIEIIGSVIKKGKREVTIIAGKSFRFIIPVEDLPECITPNDSCDLSVANVQKELP
ncbi:MAG: hypothetical protein KAT09_08805 [Candidatus Aegiribacteria sp.]|nr:hypothetical protein [Candidatus Aegiribacteria sp.]